MTIKSTLLLCACSFVTAAAIPAFAQSMADVRLNGEIPFQFHVGGKTLPAGNYKIRSTDSGIRFTTTHGDQISYATSNTARVPGAPGQPHLVFRRYGSQLYLAQIWTGSSGREFPVSPNERKIAREMQGGPSQLSLDIR